LRNATQNERGGKRGFTTETGRKRQRKFFRGSGKKEDAKSQRKKKRFVELVKERET